MQRFDKGETVPRWIFNVTPKGRAAVWGTDVEVLAGEEGASVYPLRPLADGECVVRIDGIEPCEIRGAPTHVHSAPRAHADSES